jgi:hypothetical protein
VSGLYINDNSLSYAGLFGVVLHEGGGNDATVKNLGVTGVDITAGGNVGAIAGFIRNGVIADCYSTGTVTGDGSNVGGLVGSLEAAGWMWGSTSTMTNCYSTAAVRGGGNWSGGLVGYSNWSNVINSAALNPSVVLTNINGPSGRVVGQSDNAAPFNNVAFHAMTGNFRHANGDDISGAEIHADGTIGGLFTAPVWTTANGSLPGFGTVVPMPYYIDSADRTLIAATPITGITFPRTSAPPSTEIDDGEGYTATLSWDGGTPAAFVAGTVYTATITLTALDGYALKGFTNTDDIAGFTVNTIAPTEFISGSDATLVFKITFPPALDIAIEWYLANPNATTFEVTTADELASIAAIVNGNWGGGGAVDFSGKTISLTNDVNLTGEWTPIGTYDVSGTSTNPFNGTFDGGGNIVSGLVINDATFNHAGFFGYIGSDATVKNLGVVNVNIAAGDYVGGIAGYVDGGAIQNCYSTGTVKGREYVGGIAGVVGGTVANSYSTAAISGNRYAGGVVGRVMAGTVSYCYSTGAISGDGFVGGVAGLMNGNSAVTNCAALNPSLAGAATETHGRIIGDAWWGTASDNIAFSDMTALSFNTQRGEREPERDCHGADITKDDVLADGTIGGLFADGDIWTAEDGKLPGLFGKTVNLPVHFGGTSVASADRVIPGDTVEEATVIIPAGPLDSEFTAGPNPVARSSGIVNFYHQGRRINDGVLTIFDASGNVVNRVNISDRLITTGNQDRRVIGSWDLTDSRGRLVSEGTYLARGVLTTVDGKSERVSVVVGVR